MNNIKPGKFIVVEGIEGAGKSSAIQVIKTVLSAHNINYINTREPGGTPLAEKLRALVKSADHDESVTQETELLLMYASRSQLLANKILPALQQGIWVIGDRHDLSSRAYQGGGRGFSDQLMDTIATITLKGFTPDLTLYLDIDPKVGLARAQARGALDRIELEKISFFQRVREKYLTIAKQDETIECIDASMNMADVHLAIEEKLNIFINNELG